VQREINLFLQTKGKIKKEKRKKGGKWKNLTAGVRKP
jgi:hypothetical protein